MSVGTHLSEQISHRDWLIGMALSGIASVKPPPYESGSAPDFTAYAAQQVSLAAAIADAALAERKPK
ncbi:hypothetical protein [Novosphingobium sp.]|uniref:hypothetical protein n=1 Tax=Novosphingobium sp. TaxID=1874826 RepID=UPI00286E8BD7|nr:hypothetical protein [Novosphingobium sp.]